MNCIEKSVFSLLLFKNALRQTILPFFCVETFASSFQECVERNLCKLFWAVAYCRWASSTLLGKLFSSLNTFLKIEHMELLYKIICITDVCGEHILAALLSHSLTLVLHLTLHNLQSKSDCKR